MTATASRPAISIFDSEPVPGAVAVTGVGVLSGTGIGLDNLVAAVESPPAPSTVTAMFEELMPRRTAHALVDFRVRDHLGRKGTSFFDRSTSLSMVACQQALADTDLVIDDLNRGRIGITLGTTAGSARSTSDYSRDTFIQDRPYLVNPLLFPNAVMNCAASQAAIRFGLHGANATIAGGPVAMLNAMRYARNLLNCGYADALLVGAVEEFSPQAAWATRYRQQVEGGTLPTGEGAAVFVVEDADAVRRSGRHADLEILSTEIGVFDPPGSEAFANGLRRCIERALERAKAVPAAIAQVASSCGGGAAGDVAEREAVRAVLGDSPDWFDIKPVIGEAHSAVCAIAVAALAGRHRAGLLGDGALTLVTSRSSDGAVGAAVVRGWSRAARDHG